jgi:hypothetical protein
VQTYHGSGILLQIMRWKKLWVFAKDTADSRFPAPKKTKTASKYLRRFFSILK